jgi:hypothetical protein
MPETGLRRSPKLEKGAFVQLLKDYAGVMSNIVTFQYNPAKLSHTLVPWDPFEVDQTQRGAQGPNVQPFDPKESWSLELEIDATDDLEKEDPIAMATGIAGKLAALKKLILPSQGTFSDLALSAAALIGSASERAVRPTVPVILFVWGPGRIVPIRIKTFSIEETVYSPTLYPLQATVSLQLEVLTPDVFKCQEDITAKIAVAVYNYTRTQEDALAIASIAGDVRSIRSLLPF